METTTLQQLGPHLPIPYKGERSEFSFKPWRMAEEKAVGDIKKKTKQLGRFVREVFDTMLETYGGKAWTSIPEGERKLLLNQMPFGCMFYMYMYLRYHALGEELKIRNLRCPSCGGDIKEFTGDLNSLEVKCSDDPNYSAVYNLKNKFLMGDIQIIGIKVGYTPWDCMEKLTGDLISNTGALKEAMLRTSVVAVIAEPGGELPNIDKMKVIQSLSKRDIEGIYAKLDEYNGGPVLGLSMNCPSCDYSWDAPLDWSWEYFFSSASQ